MPGGGRINHASVVLEYPNENKEEIVLVLGGSDEYSQHYFNSVFLLNLRDKVWREGRAMKEAREACAAVVCHGAVYAIGGERNRRMLSTIERILIEDLVSSSFASNQDHYQWSTLKCRLSVERKGCAAAVVHDRFIVVAGGEFEYEKMLSTVDIIDTCSSSTCIVVSGPQMNVPRTCFGMAVIGSRIYAVGGGLCAVGDGEDGEDDPYEIKSVEYLDADNWLQEGTSTKSWQIEENLVLGSPRYNHGMVAVGSCLVVVGGSTFEDPNSSVEVLDTERNIVWKLPELQGYVFGAYNIDPSLVCRT